MKSVEEFAHDVLKDSESLFTDAWFLIPNWKWLALGTALFSFYILLKFSRWFLNQVRKRLERRFSTREFFGLFFQRPLHRPLAGILAGAFLKTCVEEIHVPGLLEKVFVFPLLLFIGYSAILFCYLTVDALGQLFENIAQRTDNTLDDHLAPMATKVMKVFVIIFGILVVLQNFGVNVMSILAGLGLGGLALALAAQDTAANLFGSIMIILDRPFQVGDAIKMGDIEGNVVEVGLRSTRVRTGGTTIISIPNAVMAKEKIENVGIRKAILEKHVFGLPTETSPETVQKLLADIRNLLAQQPKIAKNDQGVTVSLAANFNLQVTVTYFIAIDDAKEEAPTNEAVLFGIIQLMKQLKLDFAFPTQSVRLTEKSVNR